eukprot:12131782-Heterocapsa_arctica.AAC.1
MRRRLKGGVTLFSGRKEGNKVLTCFSTEKLGDVPTTGGGGSRRHRGRSRSGRTQIASLAAVRLALSIAC